jgi:hypothetical protein
MRGEAYFRPLASSYQPDLALAKIRQQIEPDPALAAAYSERAERLFAICSHRNQDRRMSLIFACRGLGPHQHSGSNPSTHRRLPNAW